MTKIIITTKCPYCGDTKDIEVDKEMYDLVLNRECLIQEALPDLDADDRERLTSGICPKCWDKYFGEK